MSLEPLNDLYFWTTNHPGLVQNGFGSERSGFLIYHRCPNMARYMLREDRRWAATATTPVQQVGASERARHARGVSVCGCGGFSSHEVMWRLKVPV